MSVYVVDPKEFEKRFDGYTMCAHEFKPMGQIADPYSGKLLSVFRETSKYKADAHNIMVCTEEGLEALVSHMDVASKSEKRGLHDPFYPVRKTYALNLCAVFSEEKAALEASKTGELSNPCERTQYVLNEIYRQGFHKNYR